MNPKGRVLVVGGDAALVSELTPSMIGREYEVAADDEDASFRVHAANSGSSRPRTEPARAATAATTEAAWARWASV